VLCLAGLDPSGGAGLLADVRVVEAHGFHPAGLVTALTEQNTVRCAALESTSSPLLAAQLARLVEDLDIRAVKIGMLATPDVVRVLAAGLEELARHGVPVVLDPVLRASRGVALFDPGGLELVEALQPLLALTTVLTPNVAELEALSGSASLSLDETVDAARRLLRAGPRAILAKGGHLAGDPIDLLVEPERVERFEGRRVDGVAPHGTGCALSTELACRLAAGVPLVEAAGAAVARVRQRIAQARSVGLGRPLL
jgi:hydroxymethylpyrimidine kinase/phosphomethylpyrimidine kinase